MSIAILLKHPLFWLILVLLVVLIGLLWRRRRSMAAPSAPVPAVAREDVSVGVLTTLVRDRELAPVAVAANGAAESARTPVSAADASSRGPLGDLDVIARIGDRAASVRETIDAISMAGSRGLVGSVPALIARLYDPNAEVAAAAAQSLGLIGDPRAIEPLLEVTQRNDAALLGLAAPSPAGMASSTRVARGVTDGEGVATAAEAADRAAARPPDHGTDAARLLRQQLVEGEVERDLAARVPALTEILNDPAEAEHVRFLAAAALGDAPDQAGSAALLAALQNPKPAVRFSAAAALGSIRSPQVVEALSGALRDDNEFVRSSAASALGKIADPQSLDALFSAALDAHEGVRFSGARALGELAGDRVLPELERRLKGADKSCKLALIEIMAQIQDIGVVDLLRGLLRDPDPELSYRSSVTLMGRDALANPEIVDDLVAASRRLDQEIMAWSAPERLGGNLRQGSAAAAEPIAILSPPNAEAPPAFDRFAPVGDAGAGLDPLDKLRIALGHPSPNVRGCAANALGAFGNARAVELLVTALEDTHEYVRASAVAALGRIRAPDAREHIQAMSIDRSPEVRFAVAKALVGFPGSDTASIVERMAKGDESRDVRRAAATAQSPGDQIPVGGF